jgi:hypothetical protein
VQLSAALRGLLPIQTKAKPLMGGQRLRLCRVRHWLGLRYKTGSLLGPWALTSARGALGGPRCEKPLRGSCKQVQPKSSANLSQGAESLHLGQTV